VAQWTERDWEMSTIHPGMRYPGPIPLAPKKDGKYTLLERDGNYGVVLRFQTGTGTKELRPTKEHPKLVEMVNKIKIERSGAPGGQFLINEYFHVVVPTQDSDYLFAGTYETLLEFSHDGEIVSGRAPESLEPGDPWPGPLVGARYTLAAGGADIYYKHEASPGVTKKVNLSDFHPEAAVRALTNRLMAVKGKAGGTICINEAGEFFSPVNGVVLYLGPLGEDVWFPAPDVDGP